MKLSPSKLIAARMANSMTQRVAARILGMTQGNLSNLENGKKGNSSLATMGKLCKAYGVKVEDLVE